MEKENHISSLIAKGKQPKLIHLIASHFVGDEKFNLEEYTRRFFLPDFPFHTPKEQDEGKKQESVSMENDGKEVDFKDWYHLNDVDLTELLPGCKLLFGEDNNNICYHGRECTAKHLSLYEYKDYYIQYSYSTQGDDLEVLSLGDQCDSIESLFSDLFAVGKKSHLNVDTLIPSLPKKSIETLAQLFKAIDPVNGKKRFLDFMAVQYESF